MYSLFFLVLDLIDMLHIHAYCKLKANTLNKPIQAVLLFTKCNTFPSFYQCVAP